MKEGGWGGGEVVIGGGGYEYECEGEIGVRAEVWGFPR